jgi:hypothetical protein
MEKSSINSLFSLGYDYANTVLFTTKRRKRFQTKYDSGFGSAFGKEFGRVGDCLWGQTYS